MLKFDVIIIIIMIIIITIQESQFLDFSTLFSAKSTFITIYILSVVSKSTRVYFAYTDLYNNRGSNGYSYVVFFNFNRTIKAIPRGDGGKYP